MTELKLIETERLKLPKDDEYLWRYFNIHKFLGLIQNRQFRFTRMDQFEDALEGIPYETIHKFTSLYGEYNLSLAHIIANPDKYIIKPKTALSGRLDNIIHTQTSNFVSCWFCEQRESMAMWNLYSNPDGVAIKIPFVKLKKLLVPVNKIISIKEYYCGMVDYQDFKQTDPFSANSLKKIKKVALRKDTSFKHEQELRFIVKVSENPKMVTGINSEPIELNNLRMKVVCHPRMESWKMKNIKKFLETAGLTDVYSESEIKLRY